MATLNKPGLDCDTAVLRLAVAIVAKADQVSGSVCLLVVVIFAIGIAKFAEWGDMVNIQLSTEFLFRYSTMLALVTISFAGVSALPVPVRAVVANITTFPYWTIFARYGSGMVGIRTCPTAKMMFVFAQLFGHYKDVAPAPIACLFNLRVKGMATALVVFTVAQTSALATTVIAPVSHAARFFKNRLVAMGACYLDQTLAPCRNDSLFSRVKYAVMNALAFNRAVVILASFHSPGSKFNFFIAMRACSFDSVSRWHKNLLLTVDRMLVEGVPSLIGGNENNISLLATGQQFHTFDTGIIPQKGGLLNALGIR